MWPTLKICHISLWSQLISLSYFFSWCEARILSQLSMQYFEKDRAREPRCLFCSKVYWVTDLTCMSRDSICALGEVVERCPRNSSFFCGNLISWDPPAAIAQLPLNSPPEHNLDTATSVHLSSSPHRLQGLQTLQPRTELPSQAKGTNYAFGLFCTAAVLDCNLQRWGGGDTFHLYGRRPAA